MDTKRFVRIVISRYSRFVTSESNRHNRFRRIGAAATCAFAIFALAGRPAPAQNTVSAGFQTALPLIPPSSGSTGPFGVALDKSGDLFVSDFANNRVLEVPAGCVGTSCEVTVPTTGLAGPTGLAVDGNGDVFIADYNNSRVVEVPWSSGAYGTQITLLAAGLNNPSGVALDSAGNLYIANYSATAGNQVVELPWNGSSFGAPITVVNWLNGPFGLAFDAAGDLFIADFLGDQVVELPVGCSSSSCQVTVVSGVSSGPTSVAVDDAGNVFITYFPGGQVLEVPKGCTTSACQVNLGNGLNEPAGVAVDATGNVFVGNYGSGQVLEIHQNSVNLGTVSVGSSSTVTAYFTFNSAVTLNATTPYSVLTQGVSGLDFTDAGGGTCAGTAYTSGQTCTVQISFSPKFAGLANGAVTLFDASGNIVATGYLTGTGSGPQLIFLPGTRSRVGVSLASSDGVAIDRQGNIFVADKTNRTVEELMAPAYTTAQSLGGSFSFTSPSGVAVDGAGNVFVADAGSAAIEEILAPAYTTVNLVGSGLSSPSGVAVDGAGNLYVADTGNNSVKEILQASGYATINTLASSFSSPSGVAVDSAGNVFVADAGNGAIKEILAVNGSIPSSPAINTIGSGFSAPAGVAVDNVGNVYVADTGNDAVVELTAASGFATASTLGSGFGGPSGVTVDRGGNVYVGSPATTQVAKFDYANPPTLNFIASAGSRSSPQTVTVTNYGNADLTFATPSSGTNPSVSSDFTITIGSGVSSPCPVLTTSSSPARLAAGTSCMDQLAFSSPTGGIVSGSMVITDDNLNVAASTQTVSLNGTSVAMTFTPTSLSAAQVGAAYSQTISASGGTAPYSYQVTAGALPAGLALSSAGVLSGTPTAAGSFSFTVTATDKDSYTGSQAYSTTVSSPTIKLVPASLPAAQVNVAYSQTLTAGGGTAPYTYAVTSGSLPAGVTLTSAGVLSGAPTASGSFTFTITATDSSTGTGAPFSAANSYSLKVSAPNITLAPTSLSSGQVGVVYASVSLTASGGITPYTYAVTSGSLPAGLTLTSAGVLSGTPTAAGSFSFTVTATDKDSYTGSQAYSTTVSAPTITLVPATLPAAQVNVAYSQTLTAGGGTAPYTYAVTSGSLPAGVTLTSAGVLSGTPTAGGSFPITVTATDSTTGTGPYTSSVDLTLTVNPGSATLTFAAIPPQTYGNPPFTVSASSSSSGAITYSIASGPATVDPSTGLVTLNGAGIVVIQASQAATADYGSTVAQTPINVAQQGSVTSITASSSSATPGQSITLTAAVAPVATGNPTGTITFFDGPTQLGTAVALSNGTSELTTSSLPSGSNNISALYSGDSNFLGSSSSLSAPIVVSPLDFTFTVSGAPSQTIRPGGAASFNFALAPAYTNYPGTVTLSVQGLPGGATASTSVASVSSTSGPQTITLTIQTSSAVASNHAPLNPGRHFPPLALAFLLPFLGLSGLSLKRRKLPQAFRMLVLVAAGCLAGWGLSGCSSTSGLLGHSYSVAVTATSGGMQHTAFVNLIVK